METFFFEGSVYPDIIPLTLDYRPTVRRSESGTTPAAEFEITVFVGRVRVRVTTAKASQEVAFELFTVAWDLARTYVETAGFIRAIPYTVILERAVFPDGEVGHFALGDRSLSRTHGFKDKDLESLSDIALVSLPVSLALSDLLMTLGKMHYSPIACGRVADSIARLLCPSGSRKEQWQALRETLRADEKYIRLLSEIAIPSRHGDRQEVDAKTNSEVAHRAWTLLGRYFRLVRNGPLHEMDYPTLRG